MMTIQSLVANKRLLGAGAAVLVLGAWFLLSPTKVSCNSSELFGEFQSRFKVSKEKFFSITRSSQGSMTAAESEEFERKLAKASSIFQFNIKSTTTLGKEGNMLRCQMSGDFGLPDESAFNAEYSVGKNDSGDLVWRFVGKPPYELY